MAPGGNDGPSQPWSPDSLVVEAVRQHGVLGEEVAGVHDAGPGKELPNLSEVQIDELRPLGEYDENVRAPAGGVGISRHGNPRHDACSRRVVGDHLRSSLLEALNNGQ